LAIEGTRIGGFSHFTGEQPPISDREEVNGDPTDDIRKKINSIRCME
jgi:hypothetical protein